MEQITQVFSPHYAPLYDGFYQDKDYAAEIAILLALYGRFAEGALPNSLIDLAVGTGKHAEHLLAAGIRVYANDISAEMISVAKERLGRFQSNPPIFSCGPMETLRLAGNAKADCAAAFFTALGYLVSPESLAGFFANLRENLRPGGYFFCDVWNGRQMIKNYAPQRVKQAQVAGYLVERVSLTSEQADRNALRVEFIFTVKDPEGKKIVTTFSETHLVRYFSPAELSTLAWAYGFEVLACTPFGEESTLADCWNFSLFARSRAKKISFIHSTAGSSETSRTP